MLADERPGDEEGAGARPGRWAAPEERLVLVRIALSVGEARERGIGNGGSNHHASLWPRAPDPSALAVVSGAVRLSLSYPDDVLIPFPFI